MKDKLFSENDINSLIKLVDLFDNSDDSGNIYRISAQSSDYIKELIRRKDIPDDKKKELLRRFEVRKKNQIKVEKLSLKATDIKKGKTALDSLGKELEL